MLCFVLYSVTAIAQSDLQIREVQKRLKAAGFDPGPIDSVLGNQTKEALRRYQTAKGLPVTGVLDEATRGSLGVLDEKRVLGPDFDTIKEYLQKLQLSIVHESMPEGIIVVKDENRGIRNLVVVREPPLLILEQRIMSVPAKPGDLFRRLLQMNRTLVHGAFALHQDSTLVLFRNSLQLESLDFNEVKSTIEALHLALVEYGEELTTFSRQ
jgi:hypothetical protein